MQESSNETQISKRIKKVSDTHELLEMMSRMDKNDLEAHHLSHAFKRLFALQKLGCNTVHPSQLANHVGFDNMCHMLKFKAPRMEANDLIASLKVLNYFGLKTESLIVQRLLNLIKDQINELTPSNLLFLSFLLDKMNKTPLTEALMMAIPMLFDLNLSLKLDHNNTTEMTDLFHYITLSSLKFSSKSMTSIITALTLHGSNLQLQEALSIIWSFARQRNFEPTYEKLFDNCMIVLNQDYMELSFDEMENTLSKLCSKFLSGEFIFYNEEFFNNCAKFVIEKDAGNHFASFVLKKFNRIVFVSYDLLNYIDKTIVSNHSLLSTANPTGLISFAAGFSNANYKSENWEIIKSLLHENPMLHSDKLALPWVKFANEMMSLDFYSNILLEKVFSTKFLEAFLKRETNRLDHIQLLLLWQSVKLILPDYDGPLPEQSFIEDAILVNISRPVNEEFLETLANIFGDRKCVQTNVLSNYGHCLDFVISFDVNENPIAMPCKIRAYEELPKSQVKSVVVFFNTRSYSPINYPQKLRGTFDLRQRTIEALGIRIVNISLHLLNNLKDSEKEDYIEREIRYALR